MRMYETSIDRVEEIYAFFQNPAHMPSILAPGDKAHYAWQNLSNYFPTAKVLREGPISNLSDHPDPAIGKISVTFADGTTKAVDDYFDSSTMDAMIVVREGEVVYERYKTMRHFDNHLWFSCSKTMVSTMLAMLEHDGKIDVSKKVTEYVPELAGSDWDTVTVEETLDMATGLDSTEHEVPDARTNPAQGWYHWAVSIGMYEDAQHLNETPIDVLKRMKRQKPGHTVFEYNSINTWVLQRINENVSGVLHQEMFGERIWRPIGAQGDGYLAVDKQGHAMGFGMMNSTLRDLARYGIAWTPSGSKLNGETIVPDGVKQKIHSGLRPEMYGKGVFGSDIQKDFPLDDISNRYQWDLVTPDGDQFKAGLGGQGLYVSAPNDSVVAFFSTGTQRDETLGAWVAWTITQSFKS